MEKLPFDYMNAAGWVKTVEHVKQAVQIPYITHVVVGGFTVLLRDGNQKGTNFVPLPDGSWGNALGLPNGGIPYLRTHGREMTGIIRDYGKKAVLNCSWFEPKEAGVLAETAAEFGFDIVEDNRGCPNVFDGGTQKKIPSYYPELLEKADEHIKRAVGNSIEIWEKLSPYVNPEDRVRESVRFRKTNHARITATNTIPNFRPMDNGRALITAENTAGYCGLSGRGAKMLALINAAHFAELLGIERVNGTTGINTGHDLEDFRTYCTGMQVGGAVYNADSPKPLSDIAREWALNYYKVDA